MGSRGEVPEGGLGYPTAAEATITPQFQILIVSAVKICNQCLQTSSAFGGFRLHAAKPLESGPHCPHPPMKLPGAAIAKVPTA